MRIEELTILQEHRLENETINEAKARLENEGMLGSNEPEQPGPEPAKEPDEIFADSELTIPRWKLLQPSCRIEGATQGMFRNTLTEEEIPKLENIVFVKQFNTRSLFAEDDFSGERACWSNNGYVPAREHVFSKTGQEPKSERCATVEEGKPVFHCPFAVWRNPAGEPDPNGTKPPVCKASIAFLGLDAIRLPFWVIFHGAALPIVKGFLRYISYRRKQSTQQGQIAYLHDFRLTIGLQLQTNKKGRFYVPAFEQKDEITSQEERALLLRYYGAMSGRFWPEPEKGE